MGTGPRIGVDESGKGDYFGYLVVAGVFADEKMEKKLLEIGVKDSKKLQDASVTKMAAKVRKACVYNVVKISPEKYNSLYKKFDSNLNKLLAWGHARVIENLLEKNSCPLVISDKFGDEKFLKEALMDRGRKARVVQEIRAEADVVVAAASILARAEFLKTLRALSMEVGYKLPKGSTHVENDARELIARFGEKILPMTAKVHFKVTRKILKS